MPPLTSPVKKHLFRLNTKTAEITGLCDKGIVVFIFRHRIG